MPADDISGFGWNEAKSERCLQERGFSFDLVVSAFGDPDRQVEIDDRRNYGEIRYRLHGRIAGRLFVVVYATWSHHLDHLGSEGECARKAATW